VLLTSLAKVRVLEAENVEFATIDSSATEIVAVPALRTTRLHAPTPVVVFIDAASNEGVDVPVPIPTTDVSEEIQ